MKDRNCKNCLKTFTPFRGAQPFCGPYCETIYRNKKKAQQMKEKRPKKQKEETIQELIKIAQLEFNAFIRERDRGKPCVTCGAKWNKGHQAGHYIPAGHFWKTRFLETNCFIQCVECNQAKSGNLAIYDEIIKDLITPDQLAHLEAEKNKTANFTRDELKKIATIYGLKRLILEKSRKKD